MHIDQKHRRSRWIASVMLAALAVGFAVPASADDGLSPLPPGMDRRGEVAGGGGGTFKELTMSRNIRRGGKEYRLRLTAFRGGPGQKSRISGEVCNRRNPDGATDVTQCQAWEFWVPRNDVEYLNEFGDVRINSDLPNNKGRINMRTEGKGDTDQRCGNRVRERHVEASNVEKFRIETGNNVFNVLDEAPMNGSFLATEGIGCFHEGGGGGCFPPGFSMDYIGGGSENSFLSIFLSKNSGDPAQLFTYKSTTVTNNFFISVSTFGQIPPGRASAASDLRMMEANLNNIPFFDGNVELRGMGEPFVDAWDPCNNGNKEERNKYRQGRTADSHDARIFVEGDPDINFPQGNDYSMMWHDVRDA